MTGLQDGGNSAVQKITAVPVDVLAKHTAADKARLQAEVEKMQPAEAHTKAPQFWSSSQHFAASPRHRCAASRRPECPARVCLPGTRQIPGYSQGGLYIQQSESTSGPPQLNR